MIYSLNGTIIHTGQNYIVVEWAGVGYKCLRTMNTMSKLPGTGEKTMIYTHMIVREDAVELCGFADTGELNCFKLLTNISGVGAKVGIAILSVLTPEQIAIAVSSGDSKTLTKASGVGNKLAQRIILEMKDKIKKLGIASENTASGAPSAAVVSAAANISQAVGAREILGYKNDEDIPLMTDIDPDMPVEQIIAKTLREKKKKN